MDRHLDKLVETYLVPSNTTNLLNPKLHATCFGRPRPSSSIKVHNVKPNGTCVKSTLQFVRYHIFYNCNNRENDSLKVQNLKLLFVQFLPSSIILSFRKTISPKLCSQILFFKITVLWAVTPRGMIHTYLSFREIRILPLLHGPAYQTIHCLTSQKTIFLVTAIKTLKV
jgi:hypothetical protein